MNPETIPRTGSLFPFVVEHRQLPLNERGTRFQPETRLFITEALRTSGLLAVLPDREAKSLLWLLTYLNPGGGIFAPLSLLARDLGVSEREARKRFLALAIFQWQGKPLAHHLHEGTSERFTVSSQVLGTETLESSLLLPIPATVRPPGQREAIIQASREKYARPRLEVEKIVSEQLGYHPEESAETPEGEARRGLRSLGVERDQIDALVEEFGVEACLRQLHWLPLRGAKSPGRYVVAAIQENYGPPRGLRLDHEPLPPQDSETAGEQHD